MKTSGAYNPKALAMLGAYGEHNNKKQWTKLGLCWKCQKDKSMRGGRVKIMPGLRMFVCKDCLEKK